MGSARNAVGCRGARFTGYCGLGGGGVKATTSDEASTLVDVGASALAASTGPAPAAPEGAPS
jgi:hypothetical protein